MRRYFFSILLLYVSIAAKAQVLPTGDNLGDHKATKNLNLNSFEIDNVKHLDIKAGNGNAVRFWQSNSYSISMGNSSVYKYGPVTEYSIKMNMSNTTGRGWTWGPYGLAPVAALNKDGNFKVKGQIEANKFIGDGSMLTGLSGSSLWGNDQQGGGVFYEDHVTIGLARCGYAQLSLGEYNLGSSGTEGESQLYLGGTFNQGVNKSGTKLKILGYDNDGGAVYPIYIKDEDNQTDFYIKNRQTQSGLPSMYFAGKSGIGYEPELDAMLIVSSENDTDMNTDAVKAGSIDGKAICGITWGSGYAGYFEGKAYFSSNVGIGIETPAKKLHVKGDSYLQGKVYIGSTDTYFYRDAANRIKTNDMFYVGTSSPATYLYSTHTYLGASSGDNIHLRGNKFDWSSGDGGIINTTGNVGIGTTLPKTKLHIQGGSDVSLTGNGGYLTMGKVTDLHIAIDNNEIMAKYGNANSTLHLQADGGNLVIHNSELENRRVIIEENGNVGIGTTNITAKLNINSPDLTGLKIVTNSTGYGFGIVNEVGGVNTKAYTVKYGDEYPFIVYGDGRTKIGLEPIPWGYELSVDGDVICEKIKVKKSGNWPDYILKSNYKLQSLKEVEKFILENNHLPDIPSEKEINENGFELAEMDALLLKKIEELTLHTIQQQKLIEELVEKNALLEKAILK